MMMMMHPRPRVLEGSVPWHQFYVYDLACFTDLLFTGTHGCHQFYVYGLACFTDLPFAGTYGLMDRPRHKGRDFACFTGLPCTETCDSTNSPRAEDDELARHGPAQH